VSVMAGAVSHQPVDDSNLSHPARCALAR